MNSVIISLSQMSLLRLLTSYLDPWLWLLLLTLVFVLQWLSIHWEILIMLSQFSLIFCETQNKMSCFIALLKTILVLIMVVFVIIWEIFHGKIFLISVLLMLIVNFVSGLRLELMYIFLIVINRWSLIHPHGFQVLVLLPVHRNQYFVCTYRINLLNLK